MGHRSILSGSEYVDLSGVDTYLNVAQFSALVLAVVPCV